MIRGVVNARNEIQIPLLVLDVAGFQQVIDAVLDTGFNGWLCLPHALITSLQLSWRTRGQVRFGDGRVDWIDYYEVTVVWDGVHRIVEVHALDGDILIGMSLLAGYDLKARVEVGGAVQIEAIP